MMFLTRLLAAFVLAASALVLGACANGPEEALSVSAHHPITVDPQAATLAVAVPMDSIALTDDDVARITAFAKTYKARGHGSLDIAYPSGAPNREAALRATAEVNTLLDSAGIAPEKLRVTEYRASGAARSAPVILSFTQFVATPSACGNWTEDYAYNPANTASPNFGCATRNNLAVMVADPHDLIAPREMTPGDAQRRDEVYRAYRSGEVTAADRSEAESGAVSEVNAQ